MREEVDRIDPHRDLAQHLGRARLLDERSRRVPGQPSLDHGELGVHVGDRERLVALEVAVDPLIFRRCVEDGPVEILREARVELLLPGRVVGAHLREALRPEDVLRREARRRRAIARGLHERVRILDVGQSDARGAVDERRVEAEADRVLGHLRAAERAAPRDGHLGERRRARGAVRLPVPIADDVERLVDRAAANAHRDRRLRAVPGERAPRHQHLSALLRHSEVEHTVAPELVGGDLPEEDLLDRRLRSGEPEARDDGDDEVVGAPVLERPVKDAEHLRFGDFHGGRLAIRRCW